VDIESLLLLAEDEVLQGIVGPQTVRLLNLMDPGLASPGRLRGLVGQTRSFHEFLEDPAIRAALLDLLPREEARQLTVLLGLDPRNPYAQLRSMRVRRGSQRYLDLLSFFGVDQPTGEQEESTPATEYVQPSFAMFPHQRRAIREVLERLDGDRRRVLLHMPTGSGKTRTAMHLVADILRRSEPAVVVWLAYSDELCGQAVGEFARAWQALGDREVPVHRHWGDNTTDLSAVRDGFVVAGLSKTFAGLKADHQGLVRLADRSHLVVIDEAHQAIAETYRTVLEVLVERDPTSRLLGLSATPGRTWDDPEQDRALAEFFLSQKVTLQVEGYSNPVDYLIDSGYLARPDFRSLTYDGGPGLSEADLLDVEASLDLPAKVLRRLAEDDQRSLVIVQKAIELTSRHRRVILFATTAQHARILADVLSARGVRAAAVTANTPGNERKSIIQEYKADAPEPMVLCNYGVLTTGFDAPSTSAALIARPTKSLVLYSQMVGRATRGPRAGGNTDSEIVTVVDTSLPGFGDMGQAFTNWEDVW
jgi:superfamily II DNA or RNA helicase